jgi:hypothetical protein
MRRAVHGQSQPRRGVLGRCLGRRVTAVTLSIACGGALVASAGGAASAASATGASGTAPHAAIWQVLAHRPRPFAVGPNHVFRVNSDIDADNMDASNTAHICKTVAGTCTLRAAIDAANHDTKPDEVVVPAGTYRLTTLGSLKLTASMLVLGAGDHKTFIDGADTYGIFDINGTPDPAVEIDDMTLRDGDAVDGGAVLAVQSDVILGLDILTRNVADKDGGAVYVDAASLWMNDTIVTANIANVGGGVDIEDGSAQLSNDTIGGSEPADGNNAVTTGGGVENDGGDTSVVNTDIDFNKAGQTGGGVDSNAPLSMHGGSISHNSVSNVASGVESGGGISIAYSGQLDGVHIDDNSIDSASLGGQGGGISNLGQATFVDCTADGNAILDKGTGNTDQGGGVANFATMLWTGGSISGNKITPAGSSAGLIGQGGGVYDNESTTVTGASVKNNAVTGHTSTSAAANEYLAAGGGVYDAGSLHLSHDAIDGNSLSSYDASGAGLYSETPNTTGAVGLDIGNNTARAIDTVNGGAILANQNFTLADSTIHNQTNTVTEASGGSLDGGAAIFNADAVLDDVVIKGVTNTNLSTSNFAAIRYGVLYIGNNAHLNEVAVSKISDTIPDSGEIIETIDVDGSSEWNKVSVTGVTNTAGTSGVPGGLVEEGVFSLGPASLDNTTVENVHNSALGTPGFIQAGVGSGSQINSRDLKVTNVTNLATGSKGEIEGGGLKVDHNSTFVDLEVNDISNTAGPNGAVVGGSLYLVNPTTIDQADISNTVSKTLGNEANSSGAIVDGGAVFAVALVNMTNVTLTGDRAISAGTSTNGGYGGGLYADQAVTLTNVTMNGDTASSAGWALFLNNSVQWPVTFMNTIVATNSSPGGDCASSQADPTFLSAGHNLGSDATCNFDNMGDQLGLPKLGPLRNNGGFVLTEAELKGSRSINVGNNNGCPATDARGVNRPQGGTCDIGAYELKPIK